MLDVTTPALLFPAISLLMLAYTNRFVTLAGLVRDLKAEHDEKPSESLKRQIDNLAFSMFAIFAHKMALGTVMFGLGLASLLLSLILLIIELSVSVRALKLLLQNMKQ